MEKLKKWFSEFDTKQKIQLSIIFGLLIFMIVSPIIKNTKNKDKVEDSKTVYDSGNQGEKKELENIDDEENSENKEPTSIEDLEESDIWNIGEKVENIILEAKKDYSVYNENEELKKLIDKVKNNTKKYNFVHCETSVFTQDLESLEEGGEIENNNTREYKNITEIDKKNNGYKDIYSTHTYYNGIELSSSFSQIYKVKEGSQRYCYYYDENYGIWQKVKDEKSNYDDSNTKTEFKFLDDTLADVKISYGNTDIEGHSCILVQTNTYAETYLGRENMNDIQKEYVDTRYKMDNMEYRLYIDEKTYLPILVQEVFVRRGPVDSQGNITTKRLGVAYKSTYIQYTYMYDYSNTTTVEVPSDIVAQAYEVDERYVE